MSITQQILLCLTGWIFIIIVANANKKKLDAFSFNEIVKDANNLFSTSVSYLLASTLCHYLNIVWLQWIICIILFLLSVIPFWASVLLIFSPFAKTPHKLSAFISQTLPLIIAINTYYLDLHESSTQQTVYIIGICIMLFALFIDILIVKQPHQKHNVGKITKIVILSTAIAVLVIGISVYVGMQIGESKNPNQHANDISTTESSSKPTDYIAKDYKKTVYVIEENGNWSYHDSDCEIISGIPYSINSMTKQDAVQYGYHRCNKCKP